MKKIILIILCLIILSLTKAAIVKCKADNCTWQDLVKSTSNFIKEVVVISFWIAFLLVSIGAFLIMFSGPREEWLKVGRDMIKVAIWGYILILVSGIIFDFILEFFNPKFKTFIEPQIVLAQGLSPDTYLNPLKEPINSGLNCGKNAQPIFNSKSLGKLFSCLFEAIGLLKNVAVILLVMAIIASAVYLITTPLFGLKQIPKAYKILIWSTIGLIIILLADLIKSQIEKIVK